MLQLTCIHRYQNIKFKLGSSLDPGLEKKEEIYSQNHISNETIDIECSDYEANECAVILQLPVAGIILQLAVDAPNNLTF